MKPPIVDLASKSPTSSELSTKHHDNIRKLPPEVEESESGSIIFPDSMKSASKSRHSARLTVVDESNTEPPMTKSMKSSCTQKSTPVAHDLDSDPPSSPESPPSPPKIIVKSHKSVHRSAHKSMPTISNLDVDLPVNGATDTCNINASMEAPPKWYGPFLKHAASLASSKEWGELLANWAIFEGDLGNIKDGNGRFPAKDRPVAVHD
ncbi:hypothetical protein BS47DRAFT_1392600 [Hydnum rufescens UP504]|uniref:Uncharacterized protein n=1 Tax=Hydnum rufescens UP504 TaxID=1448309 RepID=A0A9P6DX05_9AGAM|nr:hypothetical protein BS47DRAFT_1392600 [Hydnum rufescens UP504]